MNYIDKDTLLEQIDFVNLLTDIGYFVTKVGKQYKGYCPFAEHSRAAFSVNRELKLYYCFGCKHGGNMINFIMNLKSCTYYQALQYLDSYRKVNVLFAETILAKRKQPTKEIEAV